jgi:hypothetical protein
MLVQVYRDNFMKKVYKWVKRFSEGRESVTDKERSQQAELKKTLKKFVKLRVKIDA